MNQVEKIAALREQLRTVLSQRAEEFPVGVQFATIMIEDKTKHRELKPTCFPGKQSIRTSSDPFYKHISRNLNYSLNEQEGL